MKQFFYTRKSKLLLFMLLTFFAGGVSPTWAQKALPYSYGFESDGSLGDGWTLNNIANNNTSYVKVSTSSAKTGTYGYQLSSYNGGTANQLLISPEIAAPNGVIVTFAYKSSNSGSYSTETFKVGYSTTDTEQSSFTWGDAINENSGSWKTYENTFPAGTKYIAVNYTSSNKYYLYVDDFYFEGVPTGPALSVLDGETKLTSGYSYNFGLASSSDTKTFTLKNPGTESVTLSIDATNGFGISPTSTTIAAKGEQTLTITMPDATASGAVTISGDGIDDFVINVSGTKRDPNKVYLDFSDGNMPDGWTWVATGSYASSYPCSVHEGYVSWCQYGGSGYAWAFTSPKLTFTNGELIAFETAKYGDGGYSNYTPSVTVEYSLDGNAWTAIGSAFTDDTYGNWTKRSVNIPVDGVKYIRFNGWYIHMRNIYGGELPVEPKMTVTEPATLDFGLYEKDADPAPTKTFTIANTGTATLNGISVSSANSAFTITNAPTSLAAGASQDVTITMATGTTGALSSLITVSATDMTDATFTVTGTVKPAGMAVEDFEDGLPANWTNASWTFANGEATGKSSSAYLTTPKLSFSAGDFIIIKAKRYDSDTSDYLTVQGSSDNGSTWTAYSKKLQNADGLSYPDYGTMVLSDIPTTVNKLRFVGYYVIVDEISGLTYAPALSVTTGDPAATVATGSSYDFGECAANANVTYNFANSGGGTINITNVAITGEGAAAYSTNFDSENKPAVTSGSPFNLVITRTYDPSRAGAAAQEAIVTVTTSEGDFIINVTGTDKAANLPEMDFYIGDAVEKSTTGAGLGFGLVAKGSTKSIKIQNDGTGDLSITDITIPAGYTLKDGENAVATPLAVAAGANKTLTLTLNEFGKQSGTLSFTAADIAEPFTFELSGAAYDDTALSFDFNDQKIPTDWTTTGGWSSYGDGNGGYCRENGGTSQSITSQKVTVTAGEVMIFQTRRYSDSNTPALTISYCATADGEFTTPENATFGAEDTPSASAWATQIVSTIPAGDWFIRFTGTYIDVDNIHMYHASLNDPKLGVYATFDGESTYSNAVTTGTTKDMGWAQDAQSFTYYIKNDKTGTLTINSVTNTNETDFTTTVVNESNKNIAAGAALAFTVTMNATSIGEKTGTITLSTNVGNFEIPVKGFVYGDRNMVDFTDDAQYTGWTGVNVTDNVASLSSTAIETTPFAATAGEKLYVEIKGNSSYTTHSFSYSYSRDGGANWSDATALVASTYSSVPDQVFTITDIADAEAASTVLIRFTGAGLGINRIYGFEALTAPVMTLDKTADYNFGMQTEAAEYVITVTNTGTATLNNLAAALTTGTNYSVAITKPDGESTTTISAGKATVPAGQQAIITVTQLFDANNGLASLSDVLTISADDVASQVINLSGQTRDGSKWYVDFASGIPSTFVEKGNWSYSSQQAYVYTESALVSQTLTLAANEKVQFDAKKMSYGVASLKVRHSLNGGLSWSDYTDLTDTEGFNSSTYKTMEYGVGNTDASAVAMIEFLGANVYLDNIYGGTLNNEAPMIQVKKYISAYNQPVVASGTTEAFGSILAEATANYTIKNIGGGTLTITSPITTVTGVATAAVDATSLAAGESATLTITMPVEAPYGEKSGAVTVKTSLGDFVINYTATTMDPNTLNVDFSDYTLPTGWYADGWTCEYTQYLSRSNRTSDTNFITQKLNVAGTSDVLKFDAQKYGSYYASSTVLKVSYSTDRVNWTEIGNYASEMTTSWKTFEISGLAAGEYYLKFTGRYANVDNIIGWTKVAGIEHDLYVTATNFPATTDLGDDATITATVTSLRTNEKGVYAKLFIDGAETMTADAKAVNLNETQTFSFTYAIPESKTAQIKVYFSDKTEAFVTATNNMKVRYAFDEEVDPSTIAAGTFEVNMDRTFVAGWNTICLPFDINVTDIHAEAKAFSFDAYDEGTKALTFNKVMTTLEAGKPYVIYVPEAITTALQFNGAAITATEAGKSEYTMTFQGTYAPITDGSLAGCFGLTASGKIAKAKSTTTMKGFRGYFMNVPAGARVMFNGFDDDETTGIRMITIDNTAAEGTYNMQGQKVEQLKKGRLYIINGKKQVVK